MSVMIVTLLSSIISYYKKWRSDLQRIPFRANLINRYIIIRKAAQYLQYSYYQISNPEMTMVTIQM